MKHIKGPSRSRLSIRPRAIHAALARHYDEVEREDLDWEILPPAVSRAPVAGV